MNKVLATGLFAAAAALMPGGCSSMPETPQERSTLSSEADSAMARFKVEDSSLQGELDKAAGYVVFPELGKAGVIVGAAHGHGEVFEGGARVGYAELSQGTIGAQLGAQGFSELIVFKTQDALNDFKDGEFAFSANATAVAIKPGAAATARYREGIAVFIHIKGGLMAEASVGGQKFTFKPL